MFSIKTTLSLACYKKTKKQSFLYLLLFFSKHQAVPDYLRNHFWLHRQW